jgi:hypothetical protein
MSEAPYSIDVPSGRRLEELKTTIRVLPRPLTRTKWEDRERRIADAKRGAAAGEQVIRRDFGRILRVRCRAPQTRMVMRFFPVRVSATPTPILAPLFED